MMTPEISFRPICDADKAFLFELYARSREQELAVTDWSDVQKERFLRMQFEAQHRYYQEHYRHTSFDMILAAGTPIGRLYLARWPEEYRIVDIALMPDWQNKGIGSRLIRDVQEEAGEQGLPVSIHVECFNPAQHLYYRLGFKKVEDKGVYHLLAWRP